MAALKVILKKDVADLGSAGEVKHVTPGYFRNFLLPRGLAVEASAGQIRALEATANLQAGQQAKKRARSGELADQIAAVSIRIPVRLGEQGRIYGSVTNKDLSEALAAQAGITIDRHKIELREPLKSIGSHSVPIKLDRGIETHVNVELVPEADGL